ncbi:MAG: PIG-L family deacetylase [Lachnospiraceae bacterium]|nr:PIG-L family deacetylase [Lachnospiraceae bacterium]
MNNILIVGAHFDDAELGAGGTAAKLVKQGKKVYKLTLTDNVTQFSQKNISVDYDSSRRQSRLAAEELGMIEITDFEPVECSTLKYGKEIMQRVEKIIFDLNIDTLFTHFGTDMNQDHVEASRICVTAGRHCSNILQFQSNGYILDNVFYPTFFVDVSDTIEMKRKALSHYSSEHDRFNRLFETNIERNHIWGYGNEIQYAEGFNLVKYLEP